MPYFCYIHLYIMPLQPYVNWQLVNASCATSAPGSPTLFRHARDLL